jgi:hypothetical protein
MFLGDQQYMEYDSDCRRQHQGSEEDAGLIEYVCVLNHNYWRFIFLLFILFLLMNLIYF